MGKYEEALARARQGKPIDEVFPELKESEDKRIWEQLKKIVAFIPEANFQFASREECCSYLERQKEPKPLPPFDEMSPEERMNHPLYLEGFNVGKSVGEALKGRKKRVADSSKTSAEWSKEDGEMLDAMIDIVSNSLYEPLCPRKEMLDWLKALRPHWKPSEEQMVALYKAAQESPIIKENGNYLYDLYDDLRKLM